MLKVFFIIRVIINRHIMSVVLMLSISNGIIIVQPSTVESFSFEPTEMGSKFKYGSLDNGEFSLQNIANMRNAFGPIKRCWIQTFEFCQNGASEFFGSDSKTVSSVVKSSKIGNYSGHDESPRYLWDMSANEINQTFHDFLEGAFIALIAINAFLFFSKR